MDAVSLSGMESLPSLVVALQVKGLAARRTMPELPVVWGTGKFMYRGSKWQIAVRVERPVR